MSKKASLIVGLIILLLSSNNNLLDSVNIPPKEVEVIDLTITEPSEDISKSVSIISDIVKEEEDRINIAVFNKVFAESFNSILWLNELIFSKFFPHTTFAEISVICS